MQKSILIIALFLFSFINISAQNEGFGIGVILGKPTAINAKYWTSSFNAIDAAIGYKIIGKSKGLAFHVDYLFHKYTFENENIQLPLYYGVGFRVRSFSTDRAIIGFRGVGGINYFLTKEKLDFFFEVAPVFTILPGTDVDLDIGLGIRYFFK